MNTTPTPERAVTLTLTPEALSLLSTVLDFHDDDAELAENADESLDTVTALRDAVAAAVANHSKGQ